jgi:hypothetical protein
VRKAPWCERSGRAIALAIGAALLVGCGAASFRVRRTTPPVVTPAPGTRLWIATDLSDPVAERTAVRLVGALADLAPAEAVRPGAPPEAGVVVVSLGVHRSTSTRAEMVQQPVWTCDPTGACWVRYLPRVVDVPVVRVIARLGIHEAGGRILLPPRVLDLEEAGEDPLASELRLVGRLVRHVEAFFRFRTEELHLEVEGLEGELAQAALARALAGPSAEDCLALAELPRAATDDAERARRLFAAGQCWHARGLTEGDPEALRAAERLLLGAVRARPRERYADALRRAREALAELAPGPTVPEPPPSYR